MNRDARRWRAVLAWAVVLVLLGCVYYAVRSGIEQCHRLGGHYTAPAGCTTPTGRRIPLR